MRVHLIHGIHTGPVSQVKNLIPYLEAAGLTVCYPDYGFILGLETRFVNPVIRGAMLPYIERGDVLIGHSNGCAVSYDLMSVGAPVAGAVFINGALQQSIARAPGVKFIDVYFNPGDDITLAAQFAQRLGIVDLVWGELGHAGYKGADASISNFNCGATKDMPIVDGHSEFFSEPNLPAWGPFLAKRLIEHLK